jgi:hypothetical protein
VSILRKQLLAAGVFSPLAGPGSTGSTQPLMPLLLIVVCIVDQVAWKIDARFRIAIVRSLLSLTS